MSRPAPRQDVSTPADYAISRHRDELKKRFPLPPASKKPKRRSAASLSLALAALGLASGLIWLDPAYRTERFSSAIGHRQVVKLGDGSVVTLDGATRMTVSWHLRTRQVELHAGQALFRVAPALYRPFLTLAGSTEIKVLGTAYNVSRHGHDVRVTVEEGKVNVRGAGAGRLLVAGDQVLVRGGQLGHPLRVNAAEVAAWTNGRLVFDRTPLGEVLDVIRRNRQIAIRVDDRRLAELPVSGAFDSAQLDGLLALLPRILPVDLATDADGVLHLSRRPRQK